MGVVFRNLSVTFVCNHKGCKSAVSKSADPFIARNGFLFIDDRELPTGWKQGDGTWCPEHVPEWLK